MLLLGAGAGIAFNPVLLAAMGDVEPHESGLASGVVNTSFMMGGALGLAVLVSLSTCAHRVADRRRRRAARGAQRRLPARLRRRCRLRRCSPRSSVGCFLRPKPMAEHGPPDVRRCGAVRRRGELATDRCVDRIVLTAATR